VPVDLIDPWQHRPIERMADKVLITIWRNDVAPRFDQTTEVLIVSLNQKGGFDHRKTVVLPTVSAEDLCHMIITEGIKWVICGGIEDEYYQYLTWKKVKVIDSVIGPYEEALELILAERLESGANLFKPTPESEDSK
jgi:predicted Fe-Mo cluster-binding NifX family protein